MSESQRPSALPPYLRIAADIRRRIDEGELRPGDTVPSTRRLVAEWGVAMATATKALNTLRTQGWVTTAPGSGTVVSAGLRSRRPASGPDAAMTRERIVRAAISLADREGLAAVSMRRVAAEQGSGAMTLYRYVPDKEELVRLMADTAFGAHPLPEPGPPGWRAKLELAAHLQWGIYRRHSWLAPVLLTSLTDPPVLASGIALVDWQLRALDGLELDDQAKLWTLVSLNGYVGGIAITRSLETESQHGTGLTSAQRQALDHSLLTNLIATGRFPAMESLDAHLDLDEVFTFGLQRHLDGLEAFLTR